MKIPIPYQIIVDKFEQLAFKGKVPTGKASWVLRFIFRMPKQKIMRIFLEMQEYKLIKFKENGGGRYIP